MLGNFNHLFSISPNGRKFYLSKGVQFSPDEPSAANSEASSKAGYRHYLEKVRAFFGRHLKIACSRMPKVQPPSTT
jgi:hypothetical protein